MSNHTSKSVINEGYKLIEIVLNKKNINYVCFSIYINVATAIYLRTGCSEL